MGCSPAPAPKAREGGPNLLGDPSPWRTTAHSCQARPVQPASRGGPHTYLCIFDKGHQPKPCPPTSHPEQHGRPPNKQLRLEERNELHLREMQGEGGARQPGLRDHGAWCPEKSASPGRTATEGGQGDVFAEPKPPDYWLAWGHTRTQETSGPGVAREGALRAGSGGASQRNPKGLRGPLHPHHHCSHGTELGSLSFPCDGILPLLPQSVSQRAAL